MTERIRSGSRVVGAIALAFLLVASVATELLYRRLAHPISPSASILTPQDARILWAAYGEDGSPYMRPMFPWHVPRIACSLVQWSCSPPPSFRVAYAASRSALNYRTSTKVSLWTTLATALWISRHLEAAQALDVIADKRSLLATHGYAGAAMLAFAKPLENLSSEEFAKLACIDIYKQNCDLECSAGAPAKVQDILSRSGLSSGDTRELNSSGWPRSMLCSRPQIGNNGQPLKAKDAP